MTTPDFSFDGRLQKFHKSLKHLRAVTQGIQQTAELKRAIEVVLVRYSRRGADWAPKLFYDRQIFCEEGMFLEGGLSQIETIVRTNSCDEEMSWAGGLSQIEMDKNSFSTLWIAWLFLLMT